MEVWYLTKKVHFRPTSLTIFSSGIIGIFFQRKRELSNKFAQSEFTASIVVVVPGAPSLIASSYQNQSRRLEEITTQSTCVQDLVQILGEELFIIVKQPIVVGASLPYSFYSSIFYFFGKSHPDFSFCSVYSIALTLICAYLLCQSFFSLFTQVFPKRRSAYTPTVAG